MGRAAVVFLGLWFTAMASTGPSGGAAAAVPRWRVVGEGRGVPAASGSTAYFLTKRHEVIAVDAGIGTFDGGGTPANRAPKRSVRRSS